MEEGGTGLAVSTSVTSSCWGRVDEGMVARGSRPLDRGFSDIHVQESPKAPAEMQALTQDIGVGPRVPKL